MYKLRGMRWQVGRKRGRSRAELVAPAAFCKAVKHFKGLSQSICFRLVLSFFNILEPTLEQRDKMQFRQLFALLWLALVATSIKAYLIEPTQVVWEAGMPIEDAIEALKEHVAEAMQSDRRMYFSASCRS